MSDIARSKEKKSIRESILQFVCFDPLPCTVLNILFEDSFHVTTDYVYETMVIIRETGFIENVKLHLNYEQYFDACHFRRVISMADFLSVKKEAIMKNITTPEAFSSYLSKKESITYSIFVAPLFFEKPGTYFPYWTYQVQGITAPPLSHGIIKVLN